MYKTWIFTLFVAVLFWSMAISDLAAADVGSVTVELPLESRFLATEDHEPTTAWLRVHNRSDEAQTVRLEFLLRSPDGRETQRHHEIGINPNEEVRVALESERLELYGIYTIQFRLTLDDATSEWKQDTFARYRKNAPAPKGESAFPIGFASGAPRPTSWLFDIAASIGFEFHRLETRWPQVQPNPDAWNWHVLDSTIDLMEEKGIRFLPLTLGSAPWAADGHFEAPDLEAWRRWMTALAERYQGRVEFWEIWNEPDIGFFRGTVEEYIAMQYVAYEAIKSVAPDEIVATGGFTHIGHGHVKPGIYEATLAEYPESFDVFAYHRHGTFSDFYRDQHILFAELRQRTGTEEMPIVFTETGMDTRYGQRHQAETLMKKMTYASALGAKAYTWYNLMDRAGGDEATRPGHTYGLLTNPTGVGNFAEIEDQIRPKESLVAAAVTVRELRGRPHLETWADDGRTFSFLFGAPGDYLLVNWLEDERSPDVIWVVAGDMKEVSELDLFGNAAPLPIVEGRTLISLAEPRYYRFEGGEIAPSLMHPLAMAPSRVTPDQNGEVHLELELRNPLNRDIQVIADLNSHDFTVIDPPPGVKIAAGVAANLPVRLSVNEGRFGDVKPFHVNFRFGDLPWAASMEIPVTFNTIQADQGLRIRLNDLGSVTNKHEHDPHTVHLLWSGASDLSVQADISSDADAGALNLSVIVTDNRHYPAPPNAPILDGDALEIGWATSSGATGRLEIAGDLGASPRIEAFDTSIPSVEDAIESIQIQRDDNRTIYDLTLTLGEMGLDRLDTESGFRFNFAIHDNDGEGPKSWMAPMPGLGGAPYFNPADFPIVVTDG